MAYVDSIMLIRELKIEFFLLHMELGVLICMGGSREGAEGPPGKSQVAIDFLGNTDTDPPRDAIGPIGPDTPEKSQKI